MSAMEAGADMAATSVHKLGGSMTQSSVLNVREGLVDPRHVQVILSMLTTTSTSYLLLASLDVARKQLALYGHERVSKAIALAEDARRRINEIPGLYCPGEEILRNSATYALDPTKLTICVKDLGIRGFDVERMLREEFSIEVELSDLYNILCLVSWGDEPEDLDRLVEALQKISQYVRRPDWTAQCRGQNAVHANAEHVAAQGILRENGVGAAPGKRRSDHRRNDYGVSTGIPILLPGEIVTQDNIDYIEENLRAGLPVQGPDDPEIRFVKVVKS